MSICFQKVRLKVLSLLPCATRSNRAGHQANEFTLKLWEETNLETQPNECAYYHKQSYAEKKRIAELDQERQVAFEDLASLPWVGEFYGQLDG